MNFVNFDNSRSVPRTKWSELETQESIETHSARDLYLGLRRFHAVGEFAAGHFHKVFGSVDVPMSLELSGEQGLRTWHLSSEILHHGPSLQEGHYTTNVRLPSGKWVWCNAPPALPASLLRKKKVPPKKRAVSAVPLSSPRFWIKETSQCLTGPAKFVVLSLMAKLDKDDSKKYSTPKDRNMTLRRDLKTALAAAPFLWETSRSDFADGLWRALKDRTRCGATMHKDGAFRLLEHPFPIPSAQCADCWKGVTFLLFFTFFEKRKGMGAIHP